MGVQKDQSTFLERIYAFDREIASARSSNKENYDSIRKFFEAIMDATMESSETRFFKEDALLT